MLHLKVKNTLLFFVFSSLLFSSCKQREYSLAVNEELLTYSESKARLTEKEAIPNNVAPVVINKGEQIWDTNPVSDWRSGFWPGIEWYLFENTKDSFWRVAAEKSTDKLLKVIDTAVSNHDLGFQFYNSYGLGYRLTNNPLYKGILLRAADSLATLFNPSVGTILSWPVRGKERGWPHNTIIDNMMNLELLFWASKNGGNTGLYDLAFKHAETTMKNHFRADTSTFHVLVYDTITGLPLKKITHQGYADNSTWARGQAWAIYGFTLTYRETKHSPFLSTAMGAADLFLKRLPKDYIPYWDFDDPAIPAAPRDVSAAAIVASALFELSTFCTDSVKRNAYFLAATKILNSLSASYLSKNKNHAILLSSTGNKPGNKDIDVPIIYADYYFLEALLRYKKLETSKIKN
jgi:unsaturated chondroitin disaccharide hydrolase